MQKIAFVFVYSHKVFQISFDLLMYTVFFLHYFCIISFKCKLVQSFL